MQKPNHSKNVVSVKNISYSYFNNLDDTNFVLKNVNLDIHQGDYLGVIGPNGGGKTTLIKIILGLLKAKSGTVEIFGLPQEKFNKWYKVGYVAQKATDIDPKFPATVYEVVSMGRFSQGGLFKRLNNKDKEAVNTALKEVDMLDFKNTLIGNLSGGQEQRVFIARALAQEPDIIFLDEPTSGVDLVSQELFYKLLKKLNLEMGITLVLISHDIDVVTKEVTEIVAINQGVVFYGSAKEFIKEEHLEKLYVKGVTYVTHGKSQHQGS